MKQNNALRSYCDEAQGKPENAVFSPTLTKVIQVDEVLNQEALRGIANGAEAKYPGLPVFILFFAEKCDGVSWCGDSNRAEPVILSALNQFRPNCVLIVLTVKRDAYRSADYEYRQNSDISLKCVPTLARYSLQLRITTVFAL
jgi:hypothetical protein